MDFDKITDTRGAVSSPSVIQDWKKPLPSRLVGRGTKSIHTASADSKVKTKQQKGHKRAKGKGEEAGEKERENEGQREREVAEDQTSRGPEPKKSLLVRGLRGQKKFLYTS